MNKGQLVERIARDAELTLAGGERALAAFIAALKASLCRGEPVTIAGYMDDAAQFEIEDKDVALAALDDFRQSSADFSDCLLGRRNRAAGAARSLRA